MFLAQREATRAAGIPSTDYPTAKDDLDLDLIALVKSQGASAAAPPPPPPAAPAPTGDSEADVEAAKQAEAARQAALKQRQVSGQISVLLFFFLSRYLFIST